MSSIGEMKDGEHLLRGKTTSELIAGGDVMSAIWFAWTGESPSSSVQKILSACFIACLDHGEEPPSARVARITASCGKPMADAVAAGLLTLGPRHGNAAGAASVWVREAVASGESAEMVATRTLEEKKKLSGLGHPVYEIDPRAQSLFNIEKKELTKTPHADFISEVSKVMSEKKGKALPVNVDGALGAIMADLGAPAELADALFIASRTVGLILHAREEASASDSYLRGK